MTQRQQAIDYWNSLTAHKRSELSLDYFGSTLIWDEEVEAIWLKECLQEKLYSVKELKAICHEVLNMGMNLRQNQLAGYSGKSGNELLEEYLNKTL